MANSKISALTAATTPLAGTETLPVVQSSATTKVTVANLTAGRAVSALSVTTTSDSTINSITVGKGAGAVSTNTVLGSGALTTNSTGSGNTVVGYQALYSNVTTNNNTAVGYLAGYSAIGISTIASDNTFIGARAGTSVTSGRKNTFIGNTIASAGGCGSAVTTGNSNVIFGGYTGSAVPISATNSNYIVLSDGDGNVRQTIDSSGNVGIGTTTISAGYTSGNGSLTLQNAKSVAFNNASDAWSTTTTGGAITYFTDNNLYIDAKDSTSNMIFRVNGATERLRISSTGNTTFTTGNVVQGTAAKGVDFSANTPAAGKTSTILNWYEEGTWTPNQGAGLTLVGAFSSTGKYTRIGRNVTVSGTVTGATSVAVAAAGVITTNLPFTIGTAGHGNATNTTITASAAIICNTGTTVTSAGAIAATGTITFSATYFV